MADDSPMADRRRDDSLEPPAGSPGERSRLHAATRIQSSVTPADYPPGDRAAQVAAAGGDAGAGEEPDPSAPAARGEARR